MPRTRTIAWSQLKVGLLAVAAIFFVALLISFVSGGRGFFWQQYSLVTRFPDVQGLKEGAVIRVAGVEVGSVDRVEFAGAEVEVDMRINEALRDKITTDSRASIGALSLLGEATIDITPAATGRPLEDGEMVVSVPPRGQLSAVAEGATRGLDEATKLLADVRAGKGTVGRLFTDDILFKEVTAFVDSAERLTTSLTDGKGTIAQLINDPAAYKSLTATLEQLSEITGRLNRGEGSLGALLRDEAFARSLSSTTKNLDELTARVNRGEGTLGKLTTDPALFDRLNSVSGRLDKVLEDLDRGEGTAGQLLRDRELYENMNSAVREMRDLLSDIRKDPKKYLNVKVSIF